MNPVPCRDCGAMLDPSATGCNVCARNLVAERMIGKFLWIVFITLIIIAALALWLFFRVVR